MFIFKLLVRGFSVSVYFFIIRLFLTIFDMFRRETRQPMLGHCFISITPTFSGGIEMEHWHEMGSSLVQNQQCWHIVLNFKIKSQKR